MSGVEILGVASTVEVTRNGVDVRHVMTINVGGVLEVVTIDQALYTQLAEALAHSAEQQDAKMEPAEQTPADRIVEYLVGLLTVGAITQEEAETVFSRVAPSDADLVSDLAQPEAHPEEAPLEKMPPQDHTEEDVDPELMSRTLQELIDLGRARNAVATAPPTFEPVKARSPTPTMVREKLIDKVQDARPGAAVRERLETIRKTSAALPPTKRVQADTAGNPLVTFQPPTSAPGPLLDEDGFQQG